MHTKIVRGLSIRDASRFDQPHSLKLELACKLPPLHDPPPVPSRHLNSVSAEPAAGHSSISETDPICPKSSSRELLSDTVELIIREADVSSMSRSAQELSRDSPALSHTPT